MRTEIDVIDFAPFWVDEGWVVGDAPTEAQRAVATAIDTACRASGFIYLTSLGVDAQTIDAAFAASRGLFGLPEAEKLDGLLRVAPATNAGYMPYGGERLNRRRGADLKEAYNVKFPGSAFDGGGLDAVPAEFDTAARALWAAVDKLRERYCLACALALGVERDFFLGAFKSMDMATCRYLHYPPCAADGDAAALCRATEAALDGTAASSVRLGEHTDFGMFTVLFVADGAHGLQLKPVEGGEVRAGAEAAGWRDVVVPADTRGAVINTGALLARWTNDEWRATAHRVVVASAEVARAHRYSIACFMDPDADAPIVVHPRLLREGAAAKYAPTTGLEHVMMKLKELMPGPDEVEAR
jgi:isopenicillin N synthase-like dioxygenase